MGHEEIREAMEDVIGGDDLPPIDVPLFTLVSRVYGPPSEMISCVAYSGQ